MDNKSIKNEEMKQKWLKKHKKALIIGGVVVVGTTAAVIAYVVLRKKPVITAEIVDVALSDLSAEPVIPIGENPNQIIKRLCPTSPVFVSSTLRKLPKGWNASEAQLKLAESFGVKVPDGFTFVQEYTKYNNIPDCA